MEKKEILDLWKGFVKIYSNANFNIEEHNFMSTIRINIEGLANLNDVKLHP